MLFVLGGSIPSAPPKTMVRNGRIFEFLVGSYLDKMTMSERRKDGAEDLQCSHWARQFPLGRLVVLEEGCVISLGTYTTQKTERSDR